MTRTREQKLGQFFTDPKIASFMVDLAITKNTKTFLDNSVGEGVFTDIVFSFNKNIKMYACEIDKKTYMKYINKCKYDISAYHCDYLKKDFKIKFDSIVANPPYNKFQEIPDRYSYIKMFKKKYNISLSGYSNLCIYFLIKSINELKENGKCAFIMPYEFLNSGYGVVVKKYLLEKKMLSKIFKFNSNLSLFSDAITTSCIIYLENCNHDSIDFINVNSINEIKNRTFTNIINYSYDKIDPNKKWLSYFDTCNNNYKNLVPLKTYAKVKRGIATGNNNFFCLNKTLIEKFGLSKNVCIPCLTKAPDVSSIVFTAEDFNNLSNLDKKTYIFDGTRSSIKNDYDYIKYGEETEQNKSYLNMHRKPWYSIENKNAAPILLTAFNRGQIKVIRNEAMIKNLTTFHSVFINDDYKDLTDVMFCYLISPLAQSILFENKREYGDGLDKFEPNDLNDAQILDLRVISKKDLVKISNIYSRIKETQNDSCFKELDSIFSSYMN